MVRNPLTPEERRRGERLGELLREARGERSMVAVAASAGVS
ncbi:transcriptional regulator, partial [[Kitasatospora] papulosa]